MRVVSRALLILLVLVLAAVIVVANPRLPEPEGAVSSVLYAPGYYSIKRENIRLVDPSRPTAANGEFPGSAERELDGFIWYPREKQTPAPLIVYSHGYMSSTSEPAYLVDFLVPKGYVVVAVNYPLSHGGAPGGPTVADVIYQAGDVSFVIDSLLVRNADTQDTLYGRIDPERIAAVGLSLGGLTSTLTAFHAEQRDPRVAAAVSIAGPTAPLSAEFFATTSVPFMMPAADADAIVPYADNAASLPARAPNALLVNLRDGSHVGFATVASTVFRWARHPDRWICPMLLRGLEVDGAQPPMLLAADSVAGITGLVSEPCVMDTYPRAMRPPQQQMLTRLALYAFLEQHFSDDAARRQSMQAYLAGGIAVENPGVQLE